MKKAYLKQTGFTLIEILIVMALLGALAVGMLAAIDPLEQFRKGRDTSIRNTLGEAYNGLIRYYALKTRFPWQSTVGDTSQNPSGMNLADTTAQGYLQELINAGELKADFINMAGLDTLSRIILTGTYVNGQDGATLCFQPYSKGFQKDTNTIYSSLGATTTGCKSQTSGTGGTDCYWCLK